MLHQRGYHSAAILLIDGSVLMGGDRDGQREGGDVNHERFKPLYYFKPRPIILSAPSTINFNDDTVWIDVDDSPYDIQHVAFVRPGAVTHGWNMTQRFIWIEIKERSTSPNNRVRIKTPPNGTVAPPGWYLLFIHKEVDMCEMGDNCDTMKVPSEGKWIFLQ